MNRLALRMIVLSVGVLLTSGCVYRMSIQQGNYLVANSVSQLKEGMTRSQVRFLLGTPMVPDAFNDDRWDYYYYFDSRRIEEPLKRRLTVYFQDDKVSRYENLGVPTQSDLDQVERDLQKALADANKAQKRGFWSRLFGRNAKPAAEPAKPAASEEQRPPDPVPPASPAVPDPAGTPSGPT